jgi:hypothetical protein
VKSRSEKENSEYNEPIDDNPVDLGKEWLKILNYMQEGSMN